MKIKPKPYISFVATSRNDNHGGDMTRRMTLFVQGLIDQCNKHQLEAELILVEWNPPKDRDPLGKVLPKPSTKDFLQVRYIVVPPEVHDSFRYSNELPLFQMIAKNVGIRRAHGDFICCTNVDLLFSDELILELNSKTLRRGYFYRANRCDIPSNINLDWGTEKTLEFANRNILLRNGKINLFSNLRDHSQKVFQIKNVYPILHVLSKLKYILYSKQRNLIDSLDTEACGDFTLAHKDDWVLMKGYPELELYSLHIDSMLLFLASSLGLKQHIFKPQSCTYHIEHGNGWGAKDPVQLLQFTTKFHMLDWNIVKKWGEFCLTYNTGNEINSENWGLSQFSLSEYE